ncbi:MAG: protein translocase subunit SecD [Oscillospiraceae bacterium]|jgi:SecD/SecF fusion protein|nr:protein translocase subunit SecD [Oscillospiraceae bacterium]
MRKSITSIAAILLITVLLIFTALAGLDLGFFKIASVQKGVKLGLDLVGGSEITYEAEVPDGMGASELEENLEIAITMLRQRCDSLGYTEANVYKYGEKRIVLEIPNVSDPEYAVQMLGTTAVVQFRDSDGNVILDGKDLKNATAETRQLENGMMGWVVQLELQPEGRTKFQEGTKAAAEKASEGNNYVAIYLDEDLISQPTVEAQYATSGIDTDTPVITLGSNDSSYAKYLADIIKAGKLPFALRESKLQAIGAQLGEKSLDNAILAGLIGIGLVMLYMLIVYRLPGLVSVFSLALYIALFLVLMSAIGINLTLPGIAGIVLTCGMAVDANIIIFERMKEELASGRTLHASIDAGFKRAFTAIVDSNITTLIAAVVLWWRGTGTILGFAKTLFFGVVLSMLCMLTVPRILLRVFANFGVTNPKLFIGKRKEARASAFSYTKHFKKFALVSGIVSLVAIVGLVLMPFGIKVYNLSSDFIGGTMMDYEIGQEVTPELSAEVEDIVNEVTGQAPKSVTKSGNGGTIVSIKMAEIPTQQRDAVYNAVAEKYGGTDVVKVVSSEFVSASVGRDITNSAFLATTLAAALILLYIAFRFELRSGVAAILMLLHDVCVMLAFYIIFRVPMNMDFIAAVLTVIGYSINATIVVFDRVRENWKRGGGQGRFADVVDRSVSESVPRAVGTTITTLLPLILVIVLGVSSVRTFGIPIAVGVAVGCYSSLFLSAPCWAVFKGAKGKVK